MFVVLTFSVLGIELSALHILDILGNCYTTKPFTVFSDKTLNVRVIIKNIYYYIIVLASTDTVSQISRTNTTDAIPVLIH